MSGFLSGTLQAAVYRRLAEDPALVALVGSAVYDAPPEAGAGQVPADYVTLGAESVRANDSQTSRGAVHDFDVTVHSARDGFDGPKRIAAAVFDALVDARLSLAEGHLVGLRFLRARADRGPAPERRRVALRFRAVIDADL